MSVNESKVMEIVADKLSVAPAKVTVQSNFVDDLGADSLDQVELIMALEDEFGVEIPDDDASKIKTVKDALDYINAKK